MSMFGQKTLDNLKTFLSGYSTKKSVQESVLNKLESAKKELYFAIPSSFERELESLESKIRLSYN